MDQITGRFIAMDEYAGSVFDPANLHKYLYVNGNPINATDPSGYFLMGSMMNILDDGMTKLNSLLSEMTILQKVNLYATVYDISRTVTTLLMSQEGIETILGSIVKGSATSILINNLCKWNKVLETGLVGFGSIVSLDDALNHINSGDYDLAIAEILQAGSLLHAFMGATCFTKEILIATSEGDKTIEDIQVGDYVWAQDVETGEKALKKVTEVFEKETSILVHVTIGEEVINTTQTHPFYVEGKGYVEAAELKVGDVLSGLDGLEVKVEKVEIEYLNEPVKVYNFTVEDWHNYFVSDSSVLVHNANCGDVSYKRPTKFRKGTRDKVWDSAKNSNGDVIDPLTGAVMDKSKPWDMGHKPGFEFRKHKQSAEKRGISRKQFLDEHNNYEHYIPELPSSNRSHRGEDLTDNYFGD